MAPCQKDWKLLISRILLTEIDTESGVNFPISTGYIIAVKKLQIEMQKY